MAILPLPRRSLSSADISAIMTFVRRHGVTATLLCTSKVVLIGAATCRLGSRPVRYVTPFGQVDDRLVVIAQILRGSVMAKGAEALQSRTGRIGLDFERMSRSLCTAQDSRKG